ncbi:MAG: DUF1611 domain-containing protein [Thalassotalea sp.]|nr:DUF1611 domain-containing protein [Thalassotalea sp.]
MTEIPSLNAPYLLYLGDSSKVLDIKTARGIAKWRPELCLGELKRPNCQTSLDLPNLSLNEAIAKGVKTLVIGLANSGGRISSLWHEDIKSALKSGLDVASGLHAKLSDNEELVALAKTHNCRLIDLRDTKGINHIGNGIKRSGKRILTVGTDCSVGKMYTALAITNEMKAQDFKVTFAATGQTGVFIEGTGVCIDAVVADFMSGAVEQVTPEVENDHWQIVEGQGSLFNPSFAGVSMSLLHGSQPDYLVLCHEAGRKNIKDLQGYPVPSLEECLALNLTTARLTNPNVKLVGISLNTRLLTPEEAGAYIAEIEEKFQVPCFDPMRTGVERFVSQLER